MLVFAWRGRNKCYEQREESLVSYFLGNPPNKGGKKSVSITFQFKRSDCNDLDANKYLNILEYFCLYCCDCHLLVSVREAGRDSSASVGLDGLALNPSFARISCVTSGK